MPRKLVWIYLTNWSGHTCVNVRLLGWTLAFFFNLVDIASYNALVVWITTNKYNRNHELGMQLVSVHASAHASDPKNQHRRIKRMAVTNDDGDGRSVRR